jgi:hypothetical protein
MTVVINPSGQVVVQPDPPIPVPPPAPPNVQPWLAPAMPGKIYGGPYAQQGPGGPFWENT